ncbi:MAG: radical SAM protein [bacterium]|nr:radical SAM protein [bacterium]
MKIVLANSVGIDRDGYYIVHSPSRWSFSAKNYKDQFTYYPWELAYTSSLLKKETNHKVKLLDGCLEKWDFNTYFDQLKEEKPDWMIVEPSSRTYDEDLRLALACKEAFGTKLIFCGQHSISYPQEVLGAGIDYVCIGEYEYTVLELIQGKNPSDILGLYPNSRRPLLDFNSLPWPEDDDVERIRYHEPNCEYQEIQLYATRGCPLQCVFCVCGNLYYSKPNWRKRDPKNVVAELQYLRNKYPQMEGGFFDEEAHNVTKSYMLKLSKAIKDAGLNDLHYTAMCGYWTIDKEMLSTMKEAGYYKLRIGIETASPKVAEGIGLKNKFNTERLYKVLEDAKDVGMKIYGTFLFGAPGSTKEEDVKTAHLIQDIAEKDLLCDLQMSICTPQPGTPFYKISKEKGYLITEELRKFDGAQSSVVSYPDYSCDEINKMYRYAFECYDKGLQKRSKEKFLPKVRSSIREKISDDLKKVLLIRSTRMWQVNLTVEAIRNILPKSKIEVLGQLNVKNVLEDNPRVDKVYIYGNGFVNLDTFDRQLFQKLKEEEYDLVLVLHNNSLGRGFKEVDKFAKALQSKRILAIKPDGEVLSIE